MSIRPHYLVLGLTPDATPAQVKAAYRKLSKLCHPDKPGGSINKWRELQLAYEVLSDAQRRAKYDATGDDTQTPDPDAQERAQVAAIVRQIISGVLSSSRDDPGRVDFRQRIMVDLDLTRSQMIRDRQQLELKVQRVERFEGRFKTDGEDDLIGDVVKQGIRELHAQIENVDKAIKLHEKVTQVFVQYRYEMDPTDDEGQWSPAGPTYQPPFILRGNRSG